MRSCRSLSMAAVLAVVVHATPAAAQQLPIPFSSSGITAAATADPDEARRPARPHRSVLVRAWRRVRSLARRPRDQERSEPIGMMQTVVSCEHVVEARIDPAGRLDLHGGEVVRGE